MNAVLLLLSITTNIGFLVNGTKSIGWRQCIKAVCSDVSVFSVFLGLVEVAMPPLYPCWSSVSCPSPLTICLTPSADKYNNKAELSLISYLIEDINIKFIY